MSASFEALGDMISAIGVGLLPQKAKAFSTKLQVNIAPRSSPNS